ncbi:MAG: hypothetical protein ACOWYE_09870 [Desulfatiglandales bacterium]
MTQEISFYGEVSAIDDALVAIAEEIKCSSILDKNKGTVTDFFQAWYLIGLIAHYYEQDLVTKSYFTACEKLHEIYVRARDFKEEIAEELISDPRKRAFQMLIAVHTNPDFELSKIAPDERENRIHDLIFGDGAKPSVRTYVLPSKNSKDERYVITAHDWFLQRYDTYHARLITRALKNRSKEHSDRQDENATYGHLMKTDWFLWVIGSILFVVFGVLFWAFSDFSNISMTPESKNVIYRVLLGIVLYLLPGVWIIIRFCEGTIWYQDLLPRLFCGIVIGYLFLLNDQLWTTQPIKNWHDWHYWYDWFFFILRISIPMLICYVYLHIKINNTLKGTNPRSEFTRPRALSILFQGFFYSLVLGVIASDFFGNDLVEIEAGLIFFPGALGSIYPFVVLSLAPLALFVGIFTQLIWEDKPITQPI